MPGGLGIHLTLDLAGSLRFGPDVEWIDRVDYAFDESRAPGFDAAVRRYWPGLPDEALRPGYTGIRAKVGDGAHDVVLQGPEEHGVPGLVNLFGIESPGLTAVPRHRRTGERAGPAPSLSGGSCASAGRPGSPALNAGLQSEPRPPFSPALKICTLCNPGGRFAILRRGVPQSREVIE